MLDLDVTDRVGGCAPVGLAILASRPLLGLREAPGHRWIDPRPGAPDAPVLTLDPPLAGSPDGSHVAGRAPEADDELVVVGEGAAGARVVRRAAAPFAARAVAVGPRGERLAAATGGRAWVEGEAAFETGGHGEGPLVLALSPDGSAVAGSDDEGIWVARADGGERRRWDEPPVGASASIVGWSTAAGLWVFVDGRAPDERGALVRVPLSGGPPSGLDLEGPGGEPAARGHAMSPDGTRLLVSDDAEVAWVVDTGRGRSLTHVRCSLPGARVIHAALDPEDTVGWALLSDGARYRLARFGLD